MTDETKAAIEAVSAPNPARAGMLLDALNSTVRSFEPLLSQAMGELVTVRVTVDRVRPREDK